METIEKGSLIEKVIEVLNKSVIELEKFQVKVSLGKSEALDSYEETKKKLNLFLHDSRFKVKKGKEKFDEVHQKIDELRLQLNLGKTETIEAFHEQKKGLLLKTHELEVKIKSNESFKKMYSIALIQIDMFKIKLDIIESNFKNRKIRSESSFENRKQDFYRFIERLKTKYSKPKESRWEHAQTEISEALIHLKKAFSYS